MEIPSFLVFVALAAVLLGVLIRNMMKGTFWQSRLQNAIGGALVGVILTTSVLWYAYDSATRGETVLLIVYMAFFAIPSSAVVGAILFLVIGAVVRLRAKRKDLPEDHPSIPDGVTGLSVDPDAQYTYMNRPLMVWGVTIYVVFLIIGRILITIEMGMPYMGSGMVQIPNLLSIGMMVAHAVFAVLFFNLKKRSLPWFYISIGAKVVVFGMELMFMSIASTLVVAWVIWDYISHKQRDGQPLFQ